MAFEMNTIRNRVVREAVTQFTTEGAEQTKRVANDTFGAIKHSADSAATSIDGVTRRSTNLTGDFRNLQRTINPAAAEVQRLARNMQTLQDAFARGKFGDGAAGMRAYQDAVAAVNRQSQAAVIMAQQRAEREAALIEKARLAATANDNLAGSIGRVTTGYFALTSALGGLAVVGFGAAFVRSVIDTSEQFETLRASLETVTGSVAAAQTAFAALQKFAQDSPAYGLAEVTSGFIKLKSLGLDPSISALESYGNTASAMGKSLNQMVEAVADAVTGENERLKEFGIRASVEGNKVTYTFRGVSTTINRSADAIESYLRRIGEVQFAGAMERQAQTLGGAFSNLGDTISNLLDDVGRAGLAGAVTEASKALAELAGDQGGAARWIGRELGDAVRDITGYFEAWASALRTINDLMSKLPGGQLPAVPDVPFWQAPASIGMSAAKIGGDIGMWLRQQVGLSTPQDSADPRFDNAFEAVSQTVSKLGDFQKKVVDAALKGVQTLEDRIARASADPTNVIFNASQGRLRYDQASGLDKTMASQLAAAITEAENANLKLVITEAFRTFADQAALYANRANNPNPVAAPGSSAHERGVAVDISLKGMSEEQLRTLKEIMDKYGFKQPVANDPVHWLFGGEAGTKFLRDQEDALAKAQMGWREYFEGLGRGTADINASTSAIGGSIAAIEAERVVREGLDRARQAGITLSDQEIAGLRAEAAARGQALNAQATAQFYQQVSQQTDQLTAAVQLQVAAYGRSAVEIEQDRIARQMWAQVQQQGLSVTPQLTAFIDEQSAAQARASMAYQNAAQSAQAAQDVMGEFGNAAMSVLDALRQPADNLAESLGGIVMQLGDMTTAAALFGQGPLAQVLGFAGQNGQQGGLFGALLGNQTGGGLFDGFKSAARKGTELGFKDALSASQHMDLTGAPGQQQQTSPVQQLAGGISGLAAIGSGYFAGMQSGDPIMGAASGAVSGLGGGAAIASALALTGPVGWIAAGIGARMGAPMLKKPDDRAALTAFRKAVRT